MIVEKVSDITAQDIANYLRLSELSQEDENFITTLINVAIAYVLDYTGIPNREELDRYASIVIVIYVLCQDMYDTRSMYVDSQNHNTVVESILGMYQRNLL